MAQMGQKRLIREIRVICGQRIGVGGRLGRRERVGDQRDGNEPGEGRLAKRAGREARGDGREGKDDE